MVHKKKDTNDNKKKGVWRENIEAILIIIGDISHSRVARSDIIGLSRMGARVSICVPETMIPWELKNWDAGLKKIGNPVSKARIWS